MPLPVPNRPPSLLLIPDPLDCVDCYQPKNRMPPLLRWLLILLVVSLLYDWSNNWSGCRLLWYDLQHSIQQLPNQPDRLYDLR